MDKPKPHKNTAREKEEAFGRLEKATNDELAAIAQATLGYNPFVVDRFVLPSVTRAKLLKIFREKITTDKLTFEKNE